MVKMCFSQTCLEGRIYIGSGVVWFQSQRKTKVNNVITLGTWFCMLLHASLPGKWDDWEG